MRNVGPPNLTPAEAELFAVEFFPHMKADKRNLLAPTFPTLVWLGVWGAVFTACAAITFFGIDNFLASMNRFARTRSRLGDMLVAMTVLLPLSAPLFLLAAVLARNTNTLACLKLHAAALTCLIVIESVTRGSGEGDRLGLDILIRLVLWCFLLLELVTIGFLELLLFKKTSLRPWPPFLYLGSTTAILGGCFLGGILWSNTFPQRVIAGAEALAGQNPYCILADEQPVLTRRDLTALRMSSRTQRLMGSQILFNNIHGLLAIETSDGRRYFNWSYRLNGFQPILEADVRDRRASPFPPCTALPHFALGLR